MHELVKRLEEAVRLAEEQDKYINNVAAISGDSDLTRKLRALLEDARKLA